MNSSISCISFNSFIFSWFFVTISLKLSSVSANFSFGASNFAAGIFISHSDVLTFQLNSFFRFFNFCISIFGILTFHVIALSKTFITSACNFGFVFIHSNSFNLFS
jgi:hypothetical protein